jgi:hypothetical protein
MYILQSVTQDNQIWEYKYNVKKKRVELNRDVHKIIR